MAYRLGTGDGVRRTLHVAGECFSYRLYAQGDNPELLAQGRYAENAQIKREMNSLPHFPCDLAAMKAFASERSNLPTPFMERLSDHSRPYAGPEALDWADLVATGRIADPEAATLKLLARRGVA